MSMAIETITSPEELREAVHILRRSAAVAVDLEADSMFHFQERVCLLQLATAEHLWVLDPLALESLEPLRAVFASNRIRKVLHGADYDVRSLFRDFGIPIRNLFDTQIACRFLGSSATGLDAVLQSRFGIRLDKRFQKKDWSQRPLPPEMIAYAAMDAQYLLPLAEQLRAELAAAGRSLWVAEECAALSRVRPAAEGDGPLFQRFKGAGRLSPRGLAALETLLDYRRRAAQKRDRPLFKVLSNATLLALAAALPADGEALARSGLLSRRQLEIHGAALAGLLAETLCLPEERLPRYPRAAAQRPDPSAALRVEQLKAWRDRRAAQLGLDPAIVLKGALIQAVAEAAPATVRALEAIPDLRRWQRRAFGREIVTLLAQIAARQAAARRPKRRRRRRRKPKVSPSRAAPGGTGAP
jgi:ribonuclease D